MILHIILATLYLIAILTVALTAHVKGYENFLSQMSYENSFFETIGTIALFIGFLYGVYALIKYRFDTTTKIVVIISTTLFFLASMEEISWGQQIFHFPSSKYFLEHNLQEETNLHNLIDGNIFSSIIYSSIYTFLIFIPLIVKLFPTLKRIAFFRYFDFNPHIILIFLFASTFQLYFYDDFGVLVDMLTYFVALFLFGYFLIVTDNSLELKLHFLIVLLATLISILSYRVYSFFNMQYEIREAFIEIGVVLLFIEFIHKRLREYQSNTIA